MNIYFRVDSGNFIGGGHIYRCINFANYYNTNNIHFICKDFENNLIKKIPKEFIVHIITPKEPITEKESSWLGSTWQEDANECKKILKNCDVLIVDHYAIPIEWETEMKKYTKKLMVIDDYSNRQHNCCIYFNQQINKNIGLPIPKDSKTVLGQIIFNKDFEKIIPKQITECKRINIFMGAADHLNITEMLLPLCTKWPNIIFDIIIGGCNPHYEKIKNKCSSITNINLHYNLDFIGHILNNADLCIGGLSGTTYERFLLKKPCIHIVFSENQKTIIHKIKNFTDILFLNNLHELDSLFTYYVRNPQILIKKSDNCNIIDRNVFQTIKSIL